MTLIDRMEQAEYTQDTLLAARDALLDGAHWLRKSGEPALAQNVLPLLGGVMDALACATGRLEALRTEAARARLLELQEWNTAYRRSV